MVSFFGNLLVLIAFVRFRRVRSVTNYYVISLAVADLLVAMVGIPSALATSVGLPRHFRLCLFMNSILMLPCTADQLSLAIPSSSPILMLLCTGSILSLVAVTVDRFWAVVRPLTYAVDMTSRRAQIIIACCWTTATVIGLSHITLLTLANIFTGRRK